MTKLQEAKDLIAEIINYGWYPSSEGSSVVLFFCIACDKQRGWHEPHASDCVIIKARKWLKDN